MSEEARLRTARDMGALEALIAATGGHLEAGGGNGGVGSAVNGGGGMVSVDDNPVVLEFR